MFGIEKLNSPLTSPWILSNWNEEKQIIIPQDVVNQLKNYQLMGVEFLYHSYRKKLKGAILNEEDDMNYFIQIATFLNAIFNSIHEKILILVICASKSLKDWHFYLSQQGGFKVNCITKTNVSKDWHLENGVVLLVPISDLKLLDLLDLNFFSVIIEQFDTIANKRIFKNLTGDFNIGITNRSFYLEPDQKLQWTMLNWANPGCVGKMNDFYEIDNNNFENFRDSYRKWWFRLTWSFDEEFVRPTNKDFEDHENLLQEWSKKYNILYDTTVNNRGGKKVTKRKSLEIMGEKKDINNEKIKTKRSKVIYNTKTDKTKKTTNTHSSSIVSDICSEDSNSSEATIIQENLEMPEKYENINYIKLPSMDETPILTSIIKNLELSPEPIIRHKIHSSSKNFENESFFMSLFDNHEESSTLKLTKRTNFDTEMPCSSKTILNNPSEDFFNSLLTENLDKLSNSSEEISDSNCSKKYEDTIISTKTKENQSIFSQLLDDI